MRGIEFMFLNRQRLAVLGDFATGSNHLVGYNGAGNPVGCNAEGLPQIAITNPNSEVFYEGRLVLVAGTIFGDHTARGRDGCATGHVVAAVPLSDPLGVPAADDLLITVNNLLPIRVGDLLQCGDQIKPTPDI